ncbi:hypothetical protein HA402_000059 [Bradysia odoriphaga]|nr:hypothetical protein HA402_000059 [Bradysia odoriphaga]
MSVYPNIKLETIAIRTQHGISNSAGKLDIKRFGNCDDVASVQVNLTSVQYDYNDDGLCDTVHGKYDVHSYDPNVHYELWMTTYQCSPTSLSQCNENARKYVVHASCDELHDGDIGPWTMLTKAMKGSRCGDDVGGFELVSAKLLPEYLVNYLGDDPALTRHRVQMLFHKAGDNRVDNHPRGCVNIEFDVINA